MIKNIVLYNQNCNSRMKKNNFEEETNSMPEKKYEKIAEEVLQKVGGSSNVK